MEKHLDQFVDLLISYAPKVLGAIITLVVGLWLIKIIVKAVRKTMVKRKIDESLVPFLSTITSVLLKIILFISVIGMVGVEATSFVAILGAAGLAIGLSLQGTLQNFAGGVVLLILRPFKVGDVVDAKGYLGIIQEIQIFYTIIHTFDKKVVYIPNGALANSDMTNLSQQEDRRNEWKFGIAYGDDVAKAKKVIKKLIEEDDRIYKDPEPFLALHSLGDSSVNIVVRTWSKVADLWPVYFDLNEKVYNEFAKEGLNIPFPQMDVHLHKQNK
ncbi:mechanosensitive ion channel family protein [Flavobacterium sp. CS20]|uniref:mechanosensitive ion channel family protein n=1 Tax=Flavobacterium sp. CS20 TaxID=2775246 RepID=UPI001B39D7FF|nr:mechanosensitive ion channel domain-containing protein [Flavobacterium sp. CS20]QTY26222.1 mechanosensitive ion channel [Flavobacterium sp. CS20]